MAGCEDYLKGAVCPPPSSGGFFGSGLGAQQQVFGSSGTQQALWARERELQLRAMQGAPCPPPIAIAKTDIKSWRSPDTLWQAFCRNLRQEMDEWFKLDLN